MTSYKKCNVSLLCKRGACGRSTSKFSDGHSEVLLKFLWVQQELIDHHLKLKSDFYLYIIYIFSTCVVESGGIHYMAVYRKD